MRTFTIKGREFLGIMIFLLIVMFTEILFINEHCSYFTLSILSIIELVSGIIIINNFTQFKVISIPTFFVVFNWVFHCGQIILKGFNLSGSVPLDFTLYASFNNQIKAFNFYYLAQAIIVVAIVLVSGKNRHYESKYIQGIDGRISGLVFILIGIIPRLYVDGLKLAGGIASGYKGVYSLYIPQFVNTLAFFFDVGVVIQLLRIENTKVRRRLFWIILIYKAIAMMTGARQEKVAFLIIWLFIYYFYERRIRIKEIISFILIAVIGLLLIDAIGNTRATGTFSLINVLTDMTSHNQNGIISDSLGEYGSAFCSLEIPFEQVPSVSGFAFGKSYIAGFLSVVPLLVSHIPFLAGETTFVTKFHGTTFFGGSFLGEAYYNFSWAGLIVCFLMGYLAARCQMHLFEKDDNGNSTFRSVLSVVIAMSLLLLVRGYFTDMVQKIVWVYIVLRIIDRHQIKLKEKSIK